jgi:hypothetical protein
VHRRTGRLRPRAPRALTIAPAWGLTAAPARAEPLGRAGAWADEAAEIERAYGSGRTVHVSLEEFCRTLSSSDEELERLREGGVPARRLWRELARSVAAGQLERYRAAFRRFRGFDRANVLHLFATFRFDRPFADEYPEAVQVGPLWPGVFRRRTTRVPSTGRWVWYASPASAEAIAPSVLRGLGRAATGPGLVIRSPRPWRSAPQLRDAVLRTEPVPFSAWRREFREAALRIVTGSRSLLEALELGGPFLYFNGVLGSGPARRRHRPEKIVELLRLAGEAGWPADLRHDLDDFARGRRATSVAERAARHRGGWANFPRLPALRGFAPGFDDAGTALVRFAREFATGGEGSDGLVARTRSRAHP